MAQITTSTEVDRAPGAVFAYVTDPACFSEWQHGVVDGRMSGGGAPQVGAECFMTRRIGFADRSSTSVLTHNEPPRNWGVHGVDGPIRAIVKVTVDPLDSGERSRVTISLDFEGRGIGKLLVPLFVRRQSRKEMPSNMAALKERLESQPVQRE